MKWELLVSQRTRRVAYALSGLTFLLTSHLLFSQTRHEVTELKLASACGELRLTVMAENAIRVRCGNPEGVQLPELVYTSQLRNVVGSVGSDDVSTWLEASGIQAVVDKKSGSIQFRNAKGEVLTEEIPGTRRLAQNDAAGDEQSTAEVDYSLQPGEHLYGTGQFQDGYLDVARLPRKLVQLNTQIAIPFLLSSRGYGILWHNYGLTQLNPPQNHLALKESGGGASQTVDVTTNAGTQQQMRQTKEFSGEFQVATEGDYGIVLDSGQTMTDQYHLSIDGQAIFNFENRWLPGSTSAIIHLSMGSHHVRVLGNAIAAPSMDWGPAENKTAFRSPVARQIDYTVFAGNADAVIQSYRQLTGQAPLFPEWAFGFIQCRERYHSSDEIIDTAKQFRNEELPMDVIVQDWQYWGKYGWNAMRFDETHYPDPAALVRDLHELHAHLMVSVWSRFDAASDPGKEFAEKKYLIPGTTWVDFFNPEAAHLYWQKFSSRMLPLGIDAWWLDATEPENDDLHHRMTYAGSGDEYRLVYPLFVTKTVYEGLRADAPKERVMMLTRSAFLGEQRYSVATWSGDIGNDWETLRRQVAAGLDYSASGLPYWTTDTGGFFRPGKTQYTDPAYRERFIRWLEFSTFSPLMRVHGYMTNTEPWNYGPKMVEEQRRLLDLRYQLLPYLYTEAAEVTLDGGTIMRPLVMDFADDPRALEQKYEYMFGPAFLVAPVLEAGVTQAHIYAPKSRGGWYDWWTGRQIASGVEAVLDAPLGHIPLLIRAGSIVPLGGVQQYVGEKPDQPLELRIYPGADGRFKLYNDDGSTYRYEQGESSQILII